MLYLCHHHGVSCSRGGRRAGCVQRRRGCGGTPVSHPLSGARRRRPGDPADRAVQPETHGPWLCGSTLFQRPGAQRRCDAGAGRRHVAARWARVPPGAGAAQRLQRRLLSRHAAGGLFLAALLRLPHLPRRRPPAPPPSRLRRPLSAQRRPVRVQRLDRRGVLSGRGQRLPSRPLVLGARRGDADLCALGAGGHLAEKRRRPPDTARADVPDAVHARRRLWASSCSGCSMA